MRVWTWLWQKGGTYSSANDCRLLKPAHAGTTIRGHGLSLPRQSLVWRCAQGCLHIRILGVGHTARRPLRTRASVAGRVGVVAILLHAPRSRGVRADAPAARDVLVNSPWLMAPAISSRSDLVGFGGTCEVPRSELVSGFGGWELKHRCSAIPAETVLEGSQDRGASPKQRQW